MENKILNLTYEAIGVYVNTIHVLITAIKTVTLMPGGLNQAGSNRIDKHGFTERNVRAEIRGKSNEDYKIAFC